MNVKNVGFYISLLSFHTAKTVNVCFVSQDWLLCWPDSLIFNVL